MLSVDSLLASSEQGGSTSLLDLLSHLQSPRFQASGELQNEHFSKLHGNYCFTRIRIRIGQSYRTLRVCWMEDVERVAICMLCKTSSFSELSLHRF